MSRTAIVITALSAAALFALAASPARASESCKLEKDDGYIVHLRPVVARQGETLTITVETLGGEEDTWGGVAAARCFKSWKSSVASVKVSPTGEVAIAADAPPGTKVRLTARALDREIAVEFEVIARDAVVLTGGWTEVGDEGCPVATPPMRELVLQADGKFKATWAPFERYVDYWGAYSFDQATGAITLKPDGGNFVPPDADLEGKAEMLPSGQLKLSGIYFGTPRVEAGAPTDCHVFKRQGS